MHPRTNGDLPFGRHVMTEFFCMAVDPTMRQVQISVTWRNGENRINRHEAVNQRVHIPGRSFAQQATITEFSPRTVVVPTGIAPKKFASVPLDILSL